MDTLKPYDLLGCGLETKKYEHITKEKAEREWNRSMSDDNTCYS